jgi:hypothetical protein
MELAERVRARAAWLRGRLGRAAPTATLQVSLRAGAWSEGGAEERLARLCLAAAGALGRHELLGARRQGRLGLDTPSGPRLRVGPEGGRRWLALGPEELGLAPGALAERLRAGSAPAPGDAPGLELLDLSGLGAQEWRGVLLGGRLGRLCLLAPRLLPTAGRATSALGLALDFDAAWIEPDRAAAFLVAVADALSTERVA